MMKVILETETRRMVELLPENMPVREVLQQFRVDPEETLNTVNGTLLDTEDLYRNLKDISADEDVRIISRPGKPEETEECMGLVLSGSETETFEALQKIQAALNEAYRTLGKEEAPF